MSALIPDLGPAWQDDAACRNSPPELFFPEPADGTLDNTAYDAGRAICDRCPVADQCAAYALRWGIRDGLYGGLTPYAREGMHAVQVHETRCEREGCRRPFTHTSPLARWCSGTCRNAASRQRQRTVA